MVSQDNERHRESLNVESGGLHLPRDNPEEQSVKPMALESLMMSTSVFALLIPIIH
jgi:hypothetical protein